MTTPIILTVDDDPQVLNAVERDLRRHYRNDYRIIKASSGAEALDALQQLKQRNSPVALFLVDQRMPTMTGTEFLDQARKLYPQARKVLLTAYADTEAAIASINSIGLDYYLMKPWSPPEQKLYPVLDDLLDDWVTTAQMPYEGIRVAGTLWSSSSHRVKDFLARNRIPYQWLDIERDAQARELVEAAAKDQHRLPVVFFQDGSLLVEPDNRILAEKIGLQTRASQPLYDLVIIGGGPAGLAAAVYGASDGLQTVLVEREATGGQAGTSARLENYLGFPRGLSGAELAERATIQARRFGAEILLPLEATKVRVEHPYHFVTLNNGTELGCRALLIATGVSVRKLNAPGVEALTGAGIYYGAAATEAVHYRGQPVFLVGAANSAGQGAVFLSRYASKVSVLVRGDSLSTHMSHYLVQQIKGAENIEVMLNCQVVEAAGKERLQALTLKNNVTGEARTVEAAALFLFIGATAHSAMVADLVEQDEAGFIITGPDLMRNGQRPKNWRLNRDPLLMETSLPGIFAAGDIRHGVVRRIGSAVGDAAVALISIQQYLKTV